MDKMVFIKENGEITDNPKEAIRFEYFEYDDLGKITTNLMGDLTA